MGVRRPLLLGTSLAFVAGYVDAVGFVALFGLFTAHVTGNFILIGAAIGGSGVGLIGKLLALPVFVVTVALMRLVVIALGGDARAIRPILLGQAVLLIAFLALGLTAAPIDDADAPLVIGAGLVGVAAMAVQNAAGRLVLADLAPTTIMTGNTTQIVIDLVDMLRRDPSTKGAARGRLRKMLPAVIAFAAGAIAGALLFSVLSFWSLTLPIAVLLVLAPFSWAMPPQG